MQDRHNTFIAVPADVSDSDVLKRFLLTLVEKIDVAYSKRGTGGFATTNDTLKTVSSVSELAAIINDTLPKYLRKDSSNLKELHYPSMPNLTDMTLVPKKYVDSMYIEQEAVTPLEAGAELSQVISKINEIISKLNSSKLFV